MKERKIPTLIGLFVLIISVAAGVFLVQSRQLFRLAASPEETPKDVRTTNIRDDSFSVSWVTDKKTIGFVAFGRSTSLGQTAQDDQDVGEGVPRTTHHVTIKGLLPKTTYSFAVGSGSRTFDNNGEFWQVTTAPKITSPIPGTFVISGKVQTGGGLPAAGAVVYVTIPAVSSLSSLTTTSGNWSIPLSTARSDNLSIFASYSQNSPLSIFVQAGGGQISSAQAKVGGATPLPPLVLGQTHDFREIKSETPTGTSPEIDLEVVPATQEARSSGFSFEELQTPPTSITVVIKNPKEGETITTTKPEFLGTGPPGTKITITVESPQVISGVATVKTDGAWAWSPPANLEPGEHTLTVSWTDESGKKQTKGITFIVSAQASEIPAFEATPSGQISPTPTPTPSPTPTPTSTPSGVSLPSTEAGVPVAGNLTVTFAIFIMGLALIFVGTAALIVKN